MNLSNAVASTTIPGYGIATLYGIAAPRLNATLIPNLFQLSWEQTAVGFQLQGVPQVSPPVIWTTVTNVPALSNNLATVTLPITAGPRYYRLVLP